MIIPGIISAAIEITVAAGVICTTCQAYTAVKEILLSSSLAEKEVEITKHTESSEAQGGDPHFKKDIQTQIALLIYLCNLKMHEYITEEEYILLKNQIIG